MLRQGPHKSRRSNRHRPRLSRLRAPAAPFSRIRSASSQCPRRLPSPCRPRKEELLSCVIYPRDAAPRLLLVKSHESLAVKINVLFSVLPEIEAGPPALDEVAPLKFRIASPDYLFGRSLGCIEVGVNLGGVALHS